MADPKVGQLTPKQLELRRTVLGGTDAAAIMGLSRYRSAWDVWAEKMGYAQPEGDMSEDALWGLLLEPIILAEYARREDLAVHKPKRLIRHPTRRWQGAHLDGRAKDRIVDVKVRASERGWGEPGTDEIPPEVKMQILHYGAVTGAPRLDVAVLFRGQRMEVYTVLPTPEVLNDLTGEEADWWQAHVLAGEPPPYDGDPKTTAALRARYPRSRSREMVVLPAQYGLITDYRHNLRRAAFYTKQAEQLQQTLMAAMEDADVLLAPDMRITWRSHTKRSTAWKQYAQGLEELVRQMAEGTLPAGMDPLETQRALLSVHTTQREERRWLVTDTAPQIERKETA